MLTDRWNILETQRCLSWKPGHPGLLDTRTSQVLVPCECRKRKERCGQEDTSRNFPCPQGKLLCRASIGGESMFPWSGYGD